VSIGGTIGLVVRKVVDRCYKVAGREEIFHVHHDGSIEDGLHLLIVGNGHVQEILVFREFLRMK
jgi:hypothetical protein